MVTIAVDNLFQYPPNMYMLYQSCKTLNTALECKQHFQTSADPGTLHVTCFKGSWHNKKAV